MCRVVRALVCGEEAYCKHANRASAAQRKRVSSTSTLPIKLNYLASTHTNTHDVNATSIFRLPTLAVHSPTRNANVSSYAGSPSRSLSLSQMNTVATARSLWRTISSP